MRNFAFNTAGIFLLVLCLSLGAAPGPQPRGVDTLEGTFTLKLDRCPVLVVPVRTPEGDWQPVDYWLVFASPVDEQQAQKIEEGTVVKMHGKAARGGQFRYLIVSALVK